MTIFVDDDDGRIPHRAGDAAAELAAAARGAADPPNSTDAQRPADSGADERERPGGPIHPGRRAAVASAAGAASRISRASGRRPAADE